MKVLAELSARKIQHLSSTSVLGMAAGGKGHIFQSQRQYMKKGLRESQSQLPGN